MAGGASDAPAVFLFCWLGRVNGVLQSSTGMAACIFSVTQSAAIPSPAACLQSWWGGFHMETKSCIQPFGNLSMTAAFNLPAASNVVFFLATYIYNNATQNTTWCVDFASSRSSVKLREQWPLASPLMGR